MNISGIRPYSGFYNADKIPQVSDGQVVEKTSSQETQAAETTGQSTQKTQEELDAIRAKQTFGAYDYAEQYRPEVNFDLRTSSSDLKTLDVEKAISDMQKDEVLHQYQFFVGESRFDGENTFSGRGSEDFLI